MRKEINLVSRTPQVRKTVKKLFLISVSVFSLVFFFTALLLSYNFFLNLKIRKIDQSLADLKSQINKLSLKKSKILQVSERLSSIDAILKKREDLSKKLSLVTSIISKSNLRVVNLVADGALLQIRLESANLSDLNRIVEKLSSSDFLNGSKIIKRVELVSFSFDTDRQIYSGILAFSF